MSETDVERMRTNLRMWNESVPLHVASAEYDVPAFKKGAASLRAFEIEAVGSVRGQSLLHLQCHFGMDTLSWARLGARVVGLDFSPRAIAAARALAKEVGLRARFVESNIYDAADHLREKFEVVYTGKGALWWLPDMSAWARTVAYFLRPGGRCFFLEDHPMSEVYGNGPGTKGWVLQHRYFQTEPIRDESQGTYAAPDALLKHSVSFGWLHTVSQVLGSLRDAGLEIDRVWEFPFAYWHRFPAMREDAEGWWHPTEEEGAVPLSWAVLARRPKRSPGSSPARSGR